MKTVHGTTEMQSKVALILIVIMIVFASLCYFNPGKSYWESIGPKWDKMFNPVNYNK